MWHEWNANTGDNLVMSQWACMSHVHVHGAHAIIRMGVLKDSNGLPADLNLMKLTASHFNALITQNANWNMSNMFPIVYLNENLRYYNENLAWGKQEPLIHPYMFWSSTKGEKVVKTSFCFIYL